MQLHQRMRCALGGVCMLYDRVATSNLQVDSVGLMLWNTDQTGSQEEATDCAERPPLASRSGLGLIAIAIHMLLAHDCSLLQLDTLQY